MMATFTLCRLPSRNREAERYEAGLDTVPVGLQERWQRQPLAKVLLRLVGGEAGTVGGDLETDSARLPEIDRFEVEAVDHGCGPEADARDVLTPADMRLIIRHPEGDMVDAAAA